MKLKSNSKLYVTLWGGVGDFIKSYHQNASWRCLEDLKKKYPRVKIKAITYSRNPSSRGLIKYHPCIDEIFTPNMPLLEIRELGLSHFAGEYRKIPNSISEKLRKSLPKLYLSGQDRRAIVNTKPEEKYIVLHPFSSMGPWKGESRTCLEPFHYATIARELVQKGYRVIVLGKNYSKNKPEHFNFKINGVNNLIDKTNIRVSLALIAKSDGFIGTNSGLMVWAWYKGKKSCIITSHAWKKRIKSNGFTRRRYKEPQNQVLFTPKDLTPTMSYDGILEKAVQWFS